MLISFADRISRGCDRRPVDLSLVGSRRFALNVFPAAVDPQWSSSLIATFFPLPIYTDKWFGFAGTFVRLMRGRFERFRGKTRG